MAEVIKTYSGKGLHVCGFEGQGNEADKVATFLNEYKTMFPVRRFAPDTYNSDGKLAFVWIVDIEGKVTFCGQVPGGTLGVEVKKQMDRVLYPGLGLAKVDAKIAKFAKMFCEKQYGKARDGLRKTVEKDAPESAAKKDADFILARIERKANEMKADAGKLETERRYGRAIAVYENIEKAFKGYEEGDAAAKKIKELKADETVKKEMKAAQDLEKLLEAATRGTKEQRNALLDKFAEKNKGTRAAEDAVAAKEA